MREPEGKPAHQPLRQRACAFQESMVFLNETYPNFAVMAYDHAEPDCAHQVLIAKFTVSLVDENGVETPLDYEGCREETTCDNEPGFLRGRAVSFGGAALDIKIAPMLIGRDTMAWEGGAAVVIACDEKHRVLLRFSAGKRAFMHYSPNPELGGRDFDDELARVSLVGNEIEITRSDRPLIARVSGEIDLSVRGGRAEGLSRSNACAFSVGFAETAERAAEIARIDPEAELTKISAYYKDLLADWKLDTPDPALNEAFAHARLTLEYSWQRPYGWIECIQHWPGFWHMEHTASEEWAGNAERAKECLQSQLRNLFDSGAVPDMNVGGGRRRDWGGNNQFFFRELAHYTFMTGDLSLLKEAEPRLADILRQTFREYDPTGGGVIGWGTQIGNQEDMESTPGPGGAPGVEGVRMLDEMARFMELLGRADEAMDYRRKARYALNAWRKKIVKPDLVRPIWREDALGARMLDPTYHALAYPVIYGYADDFEKAAFVDHMLHRLTGPEGEIYQSNHFGDHDYWNVPTWGMQCGSDMQPFATAAYARIGLGEEAIRPLSFIARRVCGPYQRGSWPETANEKRFAYFSPSAAVYAQAVIESVFGITRDKTRGATRIEPCFPESWDRAELTLPQGHIAYTRNGGAHRFDIDLPDGCEKTFVWRVKPYTRAQAKLDGQIVPLTTRGGCGCFEMEIALTGADSCHLAIETTPAEIGIVKTESAAQGDVLSARVTGAEFAGVIDRCGLFARIDPTPDGFCAELAGRLLDEYEPYGWFGRINFARRLYALRLRLNDVEFTMPCPVVVLPRAVCAARDGRATLINNTSRAFEPCAFGAGGRMFPVPPIPARGRVEIDYDQSNLLPGKNRACLYAGFETFPFDAEKNDADTPLTQIAADPAALAPASYWKEIGLHKHHGCILLGADEFLKGLFEENAPLSFPGVAPLALWQGFLPFGQAKRPVLDVPLGVKARKLYVALCAFCDNHDAFSVPFTLTVEAAKGEAYYRPIYRRPLALPGEIDFGYGAKAMVGFESFNPAENTPRSAAYLPRLAGSGDYPDAQPPEYPQRAIFSRNRACEAGNAVFSLIEIETNGESELKTLRVTCETADAAGGVFAVGFI